MPPFNFEVFYPIRKSWQDHNATTKSQTPRPKPYKTGTIIHEKRIRSDAGPSVSFAT